MTGDKYRIKHTRWLLGMMLAGASGFIVVTARAGELEGSEGGRSGKVHELVSWLLTNDDALKGIPFSEVIAATSGKKIIAVDRVADAEVLKGIGVAMDAVLARMNASESPVKDVGRINEVSHFFEDAMQEELGKIPGWKASFPLTADGKTQRSGYPDLQVDLPDGRVWYLDPKLFAKGSRGSSFRTFYFEPKQGTNKVNRDACHLIVGIEHDFAATGKFLRWELVDLARFKVRLKAEFEGSNRDLYREEQVVGKGEAR